MLAGVKRSECCVGHSYPSRLQCPELYLHAVVTAQGTTAPLVPYRMTTVQQCIAKPLALEMSGHDVTTLILRYFLMFAAECFDYATPSLQLPNVPGRTATKLLCTSSRDSSLRLAMS
jgi:hypothetical protein